MFDDARRALTMLRPVVAELDVEAPDDATAAQLVELFVDIERLAVAGRLLATRALEDSDLWRREGFRSAAAWMAARAGAPVGPAIAAVEMLRLLDRLPILRVAFRAGCLSVAQAIEIADAASEVPEAEQQLVDAAGKLSLCELREECRRVKAAAVIDEEDRHRRIRRGRYFRSWTDRDGAVRLTARLTADEGARLLAEVDARRDQMVTDARAGGWYEGPDAHRADALVDLARSASGLGPGGSSGVGDGGGSSGPTTMVHVWVDYEALMRGHTLIGETCEIPGVGPIPVAVARRLAGDAILKVLVTKGVDIVAVAHAGRTIPAHLRTALECRDPKCIVPHCDMRRGLQIDHRDPWAATHNTSLSNTARLCRWHHYQKSHLGYTYRGGPGTWEWIPPERPTGPPLIPP